MIWSLTHDSVCLRNNFADVRTEYRACTNFNVQVMRNWSSSIPVPFKRNIRHIDLVRRFMYLPQYLRQPAAPRYSFGYFWSATHAWATIPVYINQNRRKQSHAWEWSLLRYSISRSHAITYTHTRNRNSRKRMMKMLLEKSRTLSQFRVRSISDFVNTFHYTFNFNLPLQQW